MTYLAVEISPMKALLTPYLDELQAILKKSTRQPDPALAFYKSGARNTLFRLEALARIGRGTTDKKKFDLLYNRFKQLEDILGAMDYAEAMMKLFSSKQGLSTQAKSYFGKLFTEELRQLNLILSEDGWLNGEVFSGMLGQLDSSFDFKDDKSRKSLSEFLSDELEKVEKQYRNGELNPHDTEGGLHEFRRKIRWFSIYASSLNGLIQIKKVPATEERLKKYCTPEIVKSPFNKLPSVPKGIKPFEIQSTYFYALSWMIDELGKLKDLALENEAFEKLLQLLPADKKELKSALKKDFRSSLPFAPEEVPVRAESAIDDFIYRDRVLMRIGRDLARSC